jgi:anti-sigma factor RsiW
MTAYLDGELPPSKAAHIRAHVEGCLPCAEEIYLLSETDALVREHHRKLEPNPGGWGRVHARIARFDTGLRIRIWEAILRRGWLPVATAAGLALGLALGALGYYRHVAAEESLRSYMADYVRTREAQEWRDRTAVERPPAGRVRSLDEERSDNPFLLVRETTDDNPFRQ